DRHGAEVHHAHAGHQQPFPLRDLRELERGTRAVTLAARPAHPRVALLAVAPAPAASPGPAHGRRRACRRPVRALQSGCMPLSESHKKYLRGLGHKLKPAVTVGGAGISEALVAEFEATIAHHELVKVRVRAADREARDAAIDELARRG